MIKITYTLKITFKTAKSFFVYFRDLIVVQTEAGQLVEAIKTAGVQVMEEVVVQSQRVQPFQALTLIIINYKSF